MDKNIEPSTILRYYKATEENIEALTTPYIFLFNPVEWKDQLELQFEIDISDRRKVRNFLTEVVSAQMSLPKNAEEYKEYFILRFNLLQEAGIAEVTSGTAGEMQKVVDLLMEKILSKPKLQDRKGLIRSNFFSRTGMSCFTMEDDTLTDPFHWNTFTIAGSGFCVVYDWPMLKHHFAQEKAGIRGSNSVTMRKRISPS
jgi:hypothetical protein